MDIKQNLIKQIEMDLNISKYNDENENDYINRLIYSALSTWVVKTVYDHNVDENYDRNGVSKTYITRKVSKIVSEFIAIFPSFGEFLEGSNETEFVSFIRTSYERAGFIIPLGFDEFVTISPAKEAIIDDNLLLVRNNFNIINTRAVGLGFFSRSENIDYKICSLNDFFYLPKSNAKIWTTKYIEKINWFESSRLGTNVLYFHPKMKNKLSECWAEKFPDYSEVTLYKMNSWDYGFARETGSGIIGVKIPEWLIGQDKNESNKMFDNDVRRFMYGFKSINGNEMKAIAYKKRGYFELKLLSALPTREYTCLQFLSWPKRFFSDSYNYIIPLELFETVKKVIVNLSIVVEEKCYE